MAVSSIHKGWLKSRNNGILAAVNNGAIPGASVLATNTALDGVLLGTPVTPALAVDSLVISNLVASGDLLLAANNGGNSQAWLWVDASAGTMRLYGAGTAAVEVAATYTQVLDDILLGLGTGNAARLSWDTTDANSNQLLLQLPAAGAVDSPVLIIGQSIESLDFGAAATGADYSGVVDPTIAIFATGAVTTGAVVEFRKSRGTVAAPTVVTAGDDLGTIDFFTCVANGEYVRGARIQCDAQATQATTRGPASLSFYTATDAAPSVLTEALTISKAQLVTCAAGITMTTGDFTFAAAGDIRVAAATAAVLEISDGTTKFYALDTRVATAGVTTHTFNISAYTIASAATNVETALSVPAHTLNYTGTTQVTSEVVSVNLGARTIAGDTATLTVDKASTLKLQAPIEGTNITLTATSALRIATTTGSPTTQYGIFIESLSGGGTNRGIYLAGANGIEFAAADDIVILAATAAALEISDGTTKYYAIDTRVATASVTTHTFNISAYTIASAATNVETALAVPAHTLNYTGTTQVTSEVISVNLGARTIAGDTATLTVDKASTLKLQAPIEGTNVTLTAASALRIGDAGGTPTNQYGIFIEALTAGATADYAIWVAGASPVHLGTEGTATGALEMSGATSGTVTLTPAAATTSYTITLPPAANTNVGYQLTCAAGDTITSWAAAASVREAKDIMGEHDAQDALDKILAAKVYDFRYKQGRGTLDHRTDYVGVVADEAPWAMHYDGGVVNPVNALGYSVLAFQAMAGQIAALEAKLALLQKGRKLSA